MWLQIKVVKRIAMGKRLQFFFAMFSTSACCMIRSYFLRVQYGPGETWDRLRWRKFYWNNSASLARTWWGVLSETSSMRREIVISTDKFGPPSHALLNSPALHRQVAPQLKKGFESPDNRLKGRPHIGHKIDTLGGVCCFLGCPRTPKSQTGCPRRHPKILQGCPF